MKKKLERMNVMIFCLTIGGLFVLNCLKEDVVFSPNENRNLALKPEFSIKALINHSYTSDFEEYITDQFIARDQWVEGKTLVERLLGKVENNGVYFGKDGYLIERLAAVDHSQIDKTVNYINQFVDQLDSSVKVDMMLIPAASAIMKEKLPWISDDVDQLALIEEIGEAVADRIQFVNVNQTFLDHRNEELYFKTDHHINLKGALVAYEAYMEALGGVPTTYQLDKVKDGFLGTLGSQSGAYYDEKDEILTLDEPKGIQVHYLDDDEKMDSVFVEENLEVKDKYTYYLNGNHSLVKITTQNTEKEKLLIIRDSYANIFTPTLLNDFSEITLVDLRYYKLPISELVQKEGIDRVLFLYSGKNFMSDVNFTFLK